MMQEEAIARIKDHMEHHEIGKYPSIMLGEALDLAISALRGPTREQVERMQGEWIPYLDGEHIMPDRYYKCSKCSSRGYRRKRNFCPHCGTPMTDEAVDILWKRWKEALDDESCR